MKFAIKPLELGPYDLKIVALKIGNTFNLPWRRQKVVAKFKIAKLVDALQNVSLTLIFLNQKKENK